MHFLYPMSNPSVGSLPLICNILTQWSQGPQDLPLPSVPIPSPERSFHTHRVLSTCCMSDLVPGMEVNYSWEQNKACFDFMMGVGVGRAADNKELNDVWYC